MIRPNILEKKQTVSSTAYIRTVESSIRMALMFDKLNQEGREEALAAINLLTQAMLIFEKDERLGNKAVSTANRVFASARTKRKTPEQGQEEEVSDEN